MRPGRREIARLGRQEIATLKTSSGHLGDQKVFAG